MRAPRLQPAARGGQFAVLFVVTVLGQNKLRRQGNHVLLARCDPCRGDRDKAMEDLAIFEFGLRAAGTEKKSVPSRAIRNVLLMDRKASR